MRRPGFITFIVLPALVLAGCGAGESGISNKVFSPNSNDVFSCTAGSASPGSPKILKVAASVKPGGGGGVNVAVVEAPYVDEGDTVTLYGSGTSTISGTVQYVDRTFDSTGFTGTANLPIRYAKVQAMEDGSTVLAETTSLADGTYTLSSFTHGSGAITVRALTQTGSGTLYNAVVKDNRDSSVYAVTSSDLSGSLQGTLTNQDLLAPVADVGQAFNIFDNMVLAQEKVDTMSATSNTHTLITIYWYDGTGTGSYYTTSGSAHYIYILGSASDSDAYDDTVILHEMGHYVADVYSWDNSPGGQHSITGHYDLRLAWSEGWATFFGSVVRDLNGAATPEDYVDTLDSSTLGFSFEIESLGSNSGSISASTKGADNEAAVSAVLWDIYDTNNEGAWDDLALGYDEIWQLFDVDIPLATVKTTFETFWDEWEARYTPGELASVIGTTGRDMRYSVDAFEDTDDAIGTIAAAAITPGANEDHTFFGASDKDYWKMAVTEGTTYTISTSSLGDGADTLLTVYDSNAITQVAQDDDDADISCTPGSAIICLASKLTCTAKKSQDVYILVEPYRPLTGADLDYDGTTYPAAVTKYGYYTLTVTSP